MSKWILIGPVVGLILITTALLIGYVVVPPMIVQRIIESVQIRPGTEQYDRWVEVPQPLDFKVYIFNVTNVAEVQRGLIPKVEEIGPYIYSQTRKKHNIRISRDKERASYFSQMNFHFNAEKSAPLTEDDHIVVLNMHMNSILQTVERDTPFFLEFVNAELNNIFGPTTSFFISTTPRKFLFEGVEFCRSPIGLPQIVCSQVLERNSPSIIKSPDGAALVFSMFNHKNRTHDGLYEVNTGVRRVNRLLNIERWNNARTLRYWKTDRKGAPSTCQMINGTDATAAAPFRKEHDDFYIYSSDICRSVQLFWDKHENYRGIPAFRYQISDNFLNEMPDCFCINQIKDSLTDDAGCLYKGALDLTECLDAPVVATMPHFHEADSRYGLLIEGLNPAPEKHSIFMDIEPMTGVPLRGGKRMQFNMFLKKIDKITLTDNFKTPRLFPVLWVDEGLELNDEMTDLVKGDLINVLRLIDILQWTFVGIGAALCVGMLIWYIVARKKLNKTTSTETFAKEIPSAN